MTTTVGEAYLVRTIGRRSESQAYRRGISTSAEERARQQAFKRASEYLISSGSVGFWNDQVWISS
jgi:hypothetical protein